MHIAQLVRRRIGPFLQIPTVGLDISDGTVKYLAFDSKNTGGSRWLAAFGEFQVPEGLIVKGEIQKEAELIQLFSAWRAQEKRIPASTFFCSVAAGRKKFFAGDPASPNERG